MSERDQTAAEWHEAFIETHEGRMQAVEQALDELDRKIGVQPPPKDQPAEPSGSE